MSARVRGLSGCTRLDAARVRSLSRCSCLEPARVRGLSGLDPACVRGLSGRSRLEPTHVKGISVRSRLEPVHVRGLSGRSRLEPAHMRGFSGRSRVESAHVRVGFEARAVSEPSGSVSEVVLSGFRSPMSECTRGSASTPNPARFFCIDVRIAANPYVRMSVCLGSTPGVLQEHLRALLEHSGRKGTKLGHSDTGLRKPLKTTSETLPLGSETALASKPPLA